MKANRLKSLLVFLGFFCFWTPALYSYSFQFQNLVLIDASLGASNFATADRDEKPDPLGFSFVPGITRGSLMPQASGKIILIFRDRYMLRFEALLHSLRNQQSNLAFGLGNERAGLFFGLAQEFTLASLSQPNKLGIGPYAKVFYSIPRAMDLSFEGIFLTDALFSGSPYFSINIDLHALFMISQFRIGIQGKVHFFTGSIALLTMIQGQVNLLLGGSAPSRILNADFYFAVAGIINQNQTQNNYSVLYLGFGTALELVINPRAAFGIFFEVFPVGFILNGIDNLAPNEPAVTLGVKGRFRISRKELWKPEIIPRRPDRGGVGE